MQHREWYYIDSSTASQRGPVPSSILLRLLEKGVGITDGSLVWKGAMEEWKQINQVEPFASYIRFMNQQWYYLDSERNQMGPVATRLLLHKLKDGDIDALSLVFTNGMEQWEKIGSIPTLKQEILKINMEEEALALARLASHSDEVRTVKELDVNDSSNTFSEVLKKSFIADNGLKYYWDNAEQDWVEDDGENDVNDEDDTNINDNKDDSDEIEGFDSSKKRKAVMISITTHQESEKDNEANDEDNNDSQQQQVKRKRGKAKGKKKPTTWVYVSGLPPDITSDEIMSHFSKVGLIQLSPYDQQPKIKIYRNEDGTCKGDCSICYNAEESVKLALDVLDGGYIRLSSKISVTRASFSVPDQPKSDQPINIDGLKNENITKPGAGSMQPPTSTSVKSSRPQLSHAQIKVAKQAMKQALAWNEDDDVGIAKSSALRIIVLEGMFVLSDFDDPNFFDEIESDVASECEKCGKIDKITVFSKNPRGVIVIKFATAYAAQECIKLMNGRFFGGQKIKCSYWDGVTNFTITTASTQEMEKEEQLEESRLNEFGDWLEKEQDELPEEFRLQVEN
eukprot:gene12008-16076_t